jgi:hypothetical protein
MYWTCRLDKVNAIVLSLIKRAVLHLQAAFFY